MGHREYNFDCHWKSMEFWVGAENLAFCSLFYTMSLLFFEIYKRGLYRARSVALSKLWSMVRLSVL